MFLCLCIIFSSLPVWAETAPAAPAVQPAPTATPRVYRELITGYADSDGETHVADLQNALIALGYLSGTADGVFGAATQQAVCVFQELNGLPVTGIADLDTQLFIYTGGDIAPAPTPEPTPRVYGTTGDDILAAQQTLAQWGFLEGGADGVFGEQTEKAIKTYQTYLHNREQEYLLAQATPVPQPTPIVVPGDQPIVVDMPVVPVQTPAPYEPDGILSNEIMASLEEDDFTLFVAPVQSGDSSDEVLRVQTRLVNLGYLYGGYGAADGVFGSMTELALKYFQRLSGLEETGVADEATQRVLFSASAKKSTEYVFPYKLVVDVSEQEVYVYEWTGEAYDTLAHTMICSTGKRSTPTPLGTYQSYGGFDGEWHYFEKFDCYAKYAYGIVGDILFHSVTFNSRRDSSISRSAVRHLGSRASHGCVRLEVDSAKWIYENCPTGTTVVIQE